MILGKIILNRNNDLGLNALDVSNTVILIVLLFSLTEWALT
jgi:hypothetical protein